MILYKDVDQFDCNTGEKVKPKKIAIGIVCDYCSRIMEYGSEEADFMSCTNFEIHANSNIESWFEQEQCNVIVEGKLVEIDLWELHADQPIFHYCVYDEYEESCDRRMTLEWLTYVYSNSINVSKKTSEIIEKTIENYECKKIDGFQLCHAMSEARYRVIKYLCEKDNKYLAGLNLSY